MSTSTELRRIVGAMTGPGPKCHDGEWCDVGVHELSCPSNGFKRLQEQASRALANHADALVALVQACEQYVANDPLAHAGVCDALSAVHAIRPTP